MLHVCLGQKVSAPEIVRYLKEVRANDEEVCMYNVNEGERAAFVYKNDQGTYTVTGILAIDKRQKMFKLARPNFKSIAKHERKVFQFSEPVALVLLEVKDRKLFRKYYPNCRHFRD